MTGPRYSALLIIGVIVQSPISLPVSLEAQTIARAVAGGSGHDLVQLLNAGTGAAKTIYTSSTWRTTNISISPAGTYIAFLEVDLGSLNGPRRWIKNTLVVLDTAGVVVRRIAGDVQRYGWCGSSCVACVTGVTDETDLHFQPTGALVVDVSTGSIKTWPIASWPYLFEYAVFDSSLYVAYGAPPNGDLVIARYDARRNEVVPTSHKGLAFSFDGRFYLSQPVTPREQARLFLTRTDSEVNPSAVDSLGVPTRWLPSGGSHLLVRKVAPIKKPTAPPSTSPQVVLHPSRSSPDRDYLVYDLESRRTVGSIRGFFPEWGAPPGVVPWVSGGRVNAISRP